MTISLTRAQMKMLSPKAKKEIAFENKWSKNRTIHLFVREHGDADWSRLRTMTWGTEREHDKCRIAINAQLQGWQQTVYPRAQFKIVDGGQA